MYSISVPECHNLNLNVIINSDLANGFLNLSDNNYGDR